MKYTCKNSEFKKQGYIHRKTDNQVSYKKDLVPFNIVCYLKGKTIIVNNWGNMTSAILEFYKKNLILWEKSNSDLLKPSNSVALLVNFETGKIKLRNQKKYYNSFENIKASEKYVASIEGFSTIYLNPKKVELLINELKLITNDIS